MRVYLLAFFIPIYLAGLIYLLQPTPIIHPLPQALRSDEPGDTWQNPDQQAYFTDFDRETVINFYRDTYSLKIGPWTIKPYRLNYRPEDTATYIRKHIDSYFLEELILPLRDSLFINGWYPSVAPQNQYIPEEERAKAMIVIYGQPFDAKITLKPYPSTPLPRLLVWTLLFPVSYIVIKLFIQSLKTLWISR